MESPLKHHVIDLEGCGPVSVYVQGDLERLKEGVVFLTVHDVGASYQTWVDFVNHPSMEGVKNRAVFLHIAVPGQELGSEDLAKEFVFPSMAQIGMGLITVLDQLRVPMVVGLGDGAGANIITRFGMKHPSRVHGIIEINPACQRANAGVMERIKDQMSSLRQADPESLNDKNVSKFSEAYKKRTPIIGELRKKMGFDVLLITGTKSKNVEDSENIHKEMVAGCCSIIKVENVNEPLLEAPQKTAEALLLFSQGMGLLPTLGRRISRQDSLTNEKGGGRKMSMSELDVPNIRRLSLSPEALNPTGKKESKEEEPERPSGPMSMGDYDKPNIRRLSLATS